MGFTAFFCFNNLGVELAGASHAADEFVAKKFNPRNLLAIHGYAPVNHRANFGPR
jgi:hypothetical protein